MTAAPSADYRTLVAEIEPRAIHSEAQYENYLARFVDLDARFAALSSAEREMHELLLLLIGDYENRTVEIEAPTPADAISTLMEANGLRQKDLVGSVFETASIASEVLSGKREITKEHIRKLSRKFHVSPAVFLG